VHRDVSRPHGRRPALHPQEKWVLAWVTLHLCFLPWALGSMHLWSQCTSLALAAIGFAVAARPRRYTEADANGNAVQVQVRPLQRLWHFPVFWIGLALLAYIAIQGFNPAFRYKENAAYCWLEPLARVSWLPAGMDVPFTTAGPWRALIVHASVWLALCTVWIGFTRRLTFRLLFTFLVANGVLLAFLGLAQLLTHAPGIFWTVKSHSNSFISSFVYRNHAGAYFNLILALATGLAWWYFTHAQRHFEKSSPASVLAFCTSILGVTVLFTLSRGSTITMAVFLLLTGTLFVWSVWHQPSDDRSRIAIVGLTILLLGFIVVGLFSFNTKDVRRRFESMLADPVASVSDRTEAHAAAAEMLAARPVFGYGSGCFRYGFPEYVSKHPSIYYSGIANRRYWEHAHNDLLEYPIELGIAGSVILLSGLAWLGWRLVRCRFWRNPLALPVSMGILLTTLHAWGDFVFQNPAILATWAVLLLATTRWGELEQQPAGRTPSQD
jgi:O-antigen ligase